MRSAVEGDQLSAFPVFVDGRGTLVPIELDTVDFVVRRVFVVTGAPGGVDRGDHVVPCHQQAVLLAGRAEFRITTGPDETVSTLERVGQRVSLPADSYVRYQLADERSQVLVLAAEAYQP
jgi:hypothetical protein